jgi:hypothetical protein
MRVKCNLIKFLGGANKNKIEPVAKENLKQTKKMDYVWRKQSADNSKDRFQEKVYTASSAKVR